MEKREAKEFLALATSNPIIDVRSPGEYLQGHIPGAVNIPLFSDLERAEIGTLYKQEGQRKAIRRGLEIVSPKMADFVAQADLLGYQDALLVHCWRGGMRSESMGWLLELAGHRVILLSGGYKAYRQYALTSLGTPIRIFRLGGTTGSGKTEVLHALKKCGAQIIDLEGLACHKGSAFGGLGQDPQPSSEHFQNLLAKEVAALNPNLPVWVEDENVVIGHVVVPEPFWMQMRDSPIISFEIAQEKRLDRLCLEYGKMVPEDLEACIRQIGKRLGGQHVKSAIEAIRNGNIRAAAATVLVYYDKAYQKYYDEKKLLVQQHFVFEQLSATAIAGKLMKFIDKKLV